MSKEYFRIYRTFYLALINKEQETEGRGTWMKIPNSNWHATTLFVCAYSWHKSLASKCAVWPLNQLFHILLFVYIFFLLGLTCLLCDHFLTLRFDPKACQILSSTNRMEFHIYLRKTRHNKKHLPWDQTSNSRHNQFSLIRLASHGWSSGLLRLDVSVRISSHTFL